MKKCEKREKYPIREMTYFVFSIFIGSSLLLFQFMIKFHYLEPMKGKEKINFSLERKKVNKYRDIHCFV